MKRGAWFAFSIIAVVSAILLVVENSHSAQATTIPIGVSMGMQAPDFALQDLNGNIVNLSDYRGKPVIINFWASWCPPCREEMPDMQKFHEVHYGQVTILGVNLREAKSKVDQFVTSNGYGWIMVLDDAGDVRDLYKVRAIPTSYFIDSKGIINRVFAGPLTYDMMIHFWRNLH